MAISSLREVSFYIFGPFPKHVLEEMNMHIHWLKMVLNFNSIYGGALLESSKLPAFPSCGVDSGRQFNVPGGKANR